MSLNKVELDPNLKSSLEGVIASGEPGVGLTNPFYTDEQVYNVEQRLVFSDNWTCIGFEKDVPSNGDVFPIMLFDQALIIVRGRNQRISVFHNVCSHRGMILVNKPGNTNGLIRCPYHSWCYDLDGNLKRTPLLGGAETDEHESIDPSLYGLKRIRSATVFGLIFVNLSGTAEAFEVTNAKFLDRWGDFRHVAMHHGGLESSLDFSLESNWKLAVENFCESYHLPWVHPELNAYSRMEDHYNISEWGEFSGQGSVNYNPNISDPGGLKFENVPNLPEKWERGSEYIALFPNVLLGLHKDHFFAILVLPDGPHKCHERVEIFYYGTDCLGAKFEELRTMNAKNWESIFSEDVGVVEGMQIGRSSRGFGGGIFSPVHDVPTRCFHSWIAQQMLRGFKC